MAIRTLDIFCGAGGSSHGASLAGAKIICGIDAWKLATDTYKANFPSARVFASRLEDIDVDQLRSKIGSIDLMLASPECTNHTCAKGSAKRSELSRETAFQVVRFAAAFKPRWLVIENVIQMRKWRRYSTFKKRLFELGYCAQELVLDAQEFGTPQRRKRLIMVCALGPVAPTIKGTPRADKMTAEDILDPPGTWKTSILFKDSRASDSVVRYLNGLSQVGPSKPFLLVYYGTDGGGGWQRLDRPLRTVTTVDRFALIDQSGSEPRMRMLQVPELKRAMGFRNSYVLPFGTRREKIKLLGNAVCPPLMQAVVEEIVRFNERSLQDAA